MAGLHRCKPFVPVSVGEARQPTKFCKQFFALLSQHYLFSKALKIIK
jgi:hypothetical protein